MPVQLENINPEFRHLVDLLLLSDRMDLDLSKFKQLLRKNHGDHAGYVWDRFQRSSEIYWMEGAKFWSDRLSFLLNLGEKSLSNNIEKFLEKRVLQLFRSKFLVDINYDIEYLQYVEFCKVKQARQESLDSVREQLIDMPSHIAIDKLITIVSSFIPTVFKSLDEYAEAVARKITSSARHFDVLLALEQQGLYFNRQPIIKLAKELLLERSHSERNCRAFFYIINDPGVMKGFKEVYTHSHRDKLAALIEACDFRLLEENHLQNIKNLLELDPQLSDSIVESYADKLYKRTFSHKRANADRLIRLIQTVPQIGSKKILAYLSYNAKMSDIKYVLTAFPNLQKLAVFV